MRPSLCALVLLAGCLEERSRPGPPLLSVTLSAPTAHARDTVTGTVRAEDGSGVDSVWVWVGDEEPNGYDGRFETVVQANFRFFVLASQRPGDVIPISLQARDVEGFVSQRDTAVRIVP